MADNRLFLCPSVSFGSSSLATLQPLLTIGYYFVLRFFQFFLSRLTLYHGFFLREFQQLPPFTFSTVTFTAEPCTSSLVDSFIVLPIAMVLMTMTFENFCRSSPDHDP
ncbi:hypothetical protein AVEN_126474-1 [Araneus ventricosus]|uniref:Uncharacterized protein n=1 Tax=Araneus ventricosus TaxID=182803 RepID=A0A4Y2DHE0_ARAVE|nr:hypothetical protein AVEN_126474-1 [Araneus ventricosus]